ncbi:hypothetical protein C7C46_28310 [Streptomyces tateyamensis]|uniref:Uncharacterized protein n=1 Tax=Streptomyces tateyamensis TaxID=565073 RepID=A0A2V4NYW6_9ACTN|nr:hypothetical protein [Streptomyces tateyamensis]PYC69154.1 hypothetical protein C7C46_28310 [Streptomyces tateyamensis]
MLDRIFGAPTRWVGLLVLVGSYLAVLALVFPVRSSQAELVADLRSHRTSVVQVDTDGSRVFVQWTTAVFVHKTETYQVRYGDPGLAGPIDEFERVVEQQVAGSGTTVRFQPFDPAYGFGGLSLLVSVLYPRILGWSPLGVGACATGLLIIGHLLLDDRKPATVRGTWLGICLLTGFGFFAYLWAEPSLLPARSAKRRGESPGRGRPSGVSGALGATAVTVALLVAGGIAFVQLVHAASR